MKKLICFFMFVAFGFGCASPKEDGQPINNPGTSQPSNPAPIVKADQQPLTISEKMRCHELIEGVTSKEHWELYSFSQRQLLSGAILENVVSEVAPAKWRKLTEKQIIELLAVFFDENLNLQNIKE